VARTPLYQVSNWEEPYLTINERLAQGEEVGYNEVASCFSFHPANDGRGGEPVRYPKLGVYAGKGASHSWLWFVALFDRIRLYDVQFLDENDLCEGGLGQIQVLLVGGGDTYAMAEALQAKGAEELRAFLAQGGVYIGSCAGAYLLSDLSGPPFTPFSRFTKVQMANVSASLPPCCCLPTKFSSPYNGGYVIHPVRESLLLELSEESLFVGENTLRAPLYGGPSMVASQEETILARYYGFDEDTIFLTDKSVAEEMFLGKAAAVMRRLEKGTIWLFGPHFEHPNYHGANRIIANCIYSSMNGANPLDHAVFSRELYRAHDAVSKKALKVVRRELSNARIMAAALEAWDIHWRIGEKTYEPEKVRFFLETMWKRLSWLLKQGELMGRPADFENLSEMLCAVAGGIKELAAGLRNGDETTPAAEKMFADLKRTTALFLDVYFANKYLQWRGN